MQECYNPHHRILPVGSGASSAAFVPRRTLCVTCLLNQFERLPTNVAVQALQDTVLLLQQSFSPLFCKQGLGIGDKDSSDTGAVPAVLLASLWGSFLSFRDALTQLAESLCASSSLHRHVQLYKASLTLLSLLFSLLREAAEHAPKMGGGACSLEGAPLGVEDREEESAAGSVYHVTLSGLARRMCDAVRVGLSKEGESPAGLLLLTDLADMSPTFMRALSEHCVSAVCTFLPSLRDAYRVELTLYLLHQIFDTCATHPTLLEDLATVLSSPSNGDALRGSFLDYLAGVLETFRDDEPVVVNALCLARFLVTYETTTTALLFPRVVDSAGNSSCDSCASVPVRLFRHLTLLLLHLNVDIVVAAAETVRELIVATQLVRGEYGDIADYVIESLRTASADSAVMLVSLLNVLPTEMMPAGPTLRVIFELTEISGNAFEAAVKGPHFLAAVTDPFSNVNAVARQVVQTVHNGGGISLHCFLLQLLSLEAACGGLNIGTGTLVPETVSVLVNTLLQLVTESCGPALLEDELREGQWPFNNRLLSLSSDTMRCLISAVVFLLPMCQEFLLRLTTEIVAEALRQCLEVGFAAVDSRSLLFDGSTGTLLLFLSDKVLEHAAAVRGDGGTVADGLVERQVCHLLENDLLTQLLRVEGDAAALRARILHHFMQLTEANRNAASADLPGALLLDDSASLRALLEKSFCQHPHWAASLLLALAATSCSAPVEAHVLEEFLFRQLSLLPCFSEEARRLVVAGGGGDDVSSTTHVGDDDHAIAALTALKTSAAYHRWRGELPQRGCLHVDSVGATARVCGVPEELSFVFFQLFRSEERAWLDALQSCGWGTALLAVLVSSTVMHMKCDGPTENVKEAHDYLFSDVMPGHTEEEEEASLCHLVVTLASTCNLFLFQLFGIVRRSAATNLPLSRRVICFLCQCMTLAAGGAGPMSTAFIQTLLEQHVTPFLLFREVSALTGDVARLLVLALARLPVGVASCCDHTLFKWSLQHVAHPKAQVYTWHVVFLLLERAHGNEFALRYDSELERKLQADWTGQLSPCVAAALATVQWMVDGAMRRRKVCRVSSIVPMPLKEWARSSSQHVLLRAFIISAVERQTREAIPDMNLLQAAPMLLGWAGEMFARRCATVATSRLLYTLVKMRPTLLASLEALGLFLQVTTTATTATACPTPTSFQLSLIEERAWVFAALLFSWPPWGVSGGLKGAVDAFLATLEMPPRVCNGQKRSREEELHVADAQEVRACCAVEALVKACERQSAEHGAFPLNRAKDFFILRCNARPEVNHLRDVIFASVHEGCELFVPS
ncbi:hypothetical protein TraAM80_03229 [Trypanosoma rangeli]|uniref:Uncharacterized protein n=1 Tax=Trypanosoma rangeli TaxID=5698 RepID=A0A3S5IRM4_TRYRA|nr:uncharacterized protein TraAM80_03229 [Trypanosoma rangeli]RNF07632.1 hypothetical protein TraAM80_03229 [Trypanosoma rangeli]|eukprot:RNF07632.1 hypothetical protein TraAM80_03229 [Trypanosoma rangeli]